MKPSKPDAPHHSFSRASFAGCLGLAGILLTLTVACAPPPVYDVRLHLPLVPADLPDSAPVVGVVPFEDARSSDLKDEEEYGGRRIGERKDLDGNRQDIVLGEESVSGAVTTLFQSILRKNDFVVSDVPAWRPAQDGSPSVPRGVDAVISVRIEDFSIMVHSGRLSTEITYGLRFTAEIGIKGKEQVTIHTVKVEPKLTRPGFSQATVERNLNKYLTEALERLAEDILSLKKS